MAQESLIVGTHFTNSLIFTVDTGKQVVIGEELLVDHGRDYMVPMTTYSMLGYILREKIIFVFIRSIVGCAVLTTISSLLFRLPRVWNASMLLDISSRISIHGRYNFRQTDFMYESSGPRHCRPSRLISHWCMCPSHNGRKIAWHPCPKRLNLTIHVIG